jgi:hypothetical protein
MTLNIPFDSVIRAEPSPKDRHLEFEHRLGLRLLVGCGLSESPYGTIWPLDGPQPYESLGRLRQHPQLGEINRARVVDAAERDVATGEMGELLLVIRP